MPHRASVTVSPSIVLAHRSSEAYPSPRDFDPQRFLGDVPTPTTWLPFGGGARRCIGASFAMMEGQVILQQVLRRYRLELEDVEDVASSSSSAEKGQQLGDGVGKRRKGWFWG